MEPKWNRDAWAVQYRDTEVEGASRAFAAALECPVYADWYAKVSEQVTKTTPGGSMPGDVRDNLFILYFDEVGNRDALFAAVESGWVLIETLLSRKVYRSGKSTVELVGAENRAIIVRTPPKKSDEAA